MLMCVKYCHWQFRSSFHVRHCWWEHLFIMATLRLIDYINCLRRRRSQLIIVWVQFSRVMRKKWSMRYVNAAHVRREMHHASLVLYYQNAHMPKMNGRQCTVKLWSNYLLVEHSKISAQSRYARVSWRTIVSRYWCIKFDKRVIR